MKKTLLLLTLLFVLQITPKCSFGQHKIDTTHKCSEVIKMVGYFWRLDSLGINGFRLLASDKILNSQVDSIEKNFLFEELGKPNQIWEKPFGDGVLYVYHTYDVSKLPKDFDAPLACGYIAFLFIPGSKYLKSIEEGDIDM